MYAESSQARLEWKAKLEEAIGLRKVVQESNKVFEVETLSVDTFFAPTLMANAGPSWNNDGNFTGKVTCSVPFSKQSWISTIFNADVAGLQPPLTVVVWWQLDVRKECGLGSGMIHGVCISYALLVLLPHSRHLFSDATSTPSTNGLSMRHARRFRHLSCTCRQGTRSEHWVSQHITDDPRSHSSPIILKRLCPRHPGRQTLPRHLKNSVGIRTCSSLPLETLVAGRWSFI